MCDMEKRTDLRMVLILVVAILDKMIPDGTNELVRAGLHLASNVLIAFVALEIMRRSARRQRKIEMDSDTAESVTQEVAEATPIH